MRFHKLQDLGLKTILDIGAFKGDFSMEMRRLYPNAEIMMVEANPSCEKFLKLSGIPYEICGLLDEIKTIPFYLEERDNICSGASFLKEKTPYYAEGKVKTIQITTKTLDGQNYFGKKIDLIKLDCQGSELQILKGAEKTLENTKYLTIETSLVEYNENSPQIEEVFDFLSNKGFAAIEIIDRLISDQTLQIDFLFKKI